MDGEDADDEKNPVPPALAKKGWFEACWIGFELVDDDFSELVFIKIPNLDLAVYSWRYRHSTHNIFSIQGSLIIPMPQGS